MRVYLENSEEKEFEDKILKGLKIAPIMHRIEKNISNQIMESFNHELLSFESKYDKLIKLFSDKVKYMNNIRVILHNIDTYKKIDAEKYAIDFFKSEGFEIVDKFKDINVSMGTPPYTIQDLKNNSDHYLGRPDLVAVFTEGKDEFILIEVKTNGDGLRYEQVKWIESHPNITTVVFYLNQNIIKKDKGDEENV